MKRVVLIVEDDALVRMDAAFSIEAAGYEVIEAANADEALRLLEARTDISVLFTDIEMPGSMDGLRLAEAVRSRWPPIKLIVTSGQYHLTDNDLPRGGRFIPKPSSPDHVLKALSDLLL